MSLRSLLDIIFWSGYVVFPLTAIIIGWWSIAYKQKALSSIMFVLLLIAGWSRFIEPQMITTEYVQIETGFESNFALISDLHLGAFKGADFLQRVILEISRAPVDFIIIAGDFTYEPSADELPRLFAPLEQLEVPVYGVLGNHDVQKPGPNIRTELKEVLDAYGVKLLHNDIIEAHGLVIAGLGPHLSREDDTNVLSYILPEANTIAIVHNPDTTLSYPSQLVDLTVAGHTHGGQIRIPFLYQYAIPTRGKFDTGLSIIDNNKDSLLYITSGLGEVILPMRLFNPPKITRISTY